MAGFKKSPLSPLYEVKGEGLLAAKSDIWQGRIADAVASSTGKIKKNAPEVLERG